MQHLLRCDQAGRAVGSGRAGRRSHRRSRPACTGRRHRQVEWATSLRASQLCAVIARPVTERNGHRVYAIVTEAKWWINHCALTNIALLTEPERFAIGINTLASEVSTPI